MSATPHTDEFRDHLYNVDLEGRRVGFHPKKPNGKFYIRRIIVSIILLLLLFVTPWIEVNGDPLMLFNFPERKFIILGAHFWPQDFLLFGIGMIGMIVAIVLFTVAFGRIWCGWACPQTIFLEMVYRRIEYWIEGDSVAQRKLDKQDWNGKKILKRGSKQIIFFSIAFLVANTFLAYIIGKDNLLEHISSSPAEYPITFVAVVVFSLAFYFVFAWFREQACIMVCPYGRLQGVLLDKDSLVISYDFKRGEPRGKLKKGQELGDLGDCIDCKQCVAVCPTGIDIRNGTQLECVNCTACIDACDTIMDKVDRPRGLIRFASFNQIEKGEKWRFTPKVIAYSAVLVLILSILTGFIATRSDLDIRILRASGMVYTELDNGNIQNLYTLKIVNKAQEDKNIRFELTDLKGNLVLIGGESLLVEAGETASAVLSLELAPEEMESYSFKFNIDVMEEEDKLMTIRTAFIGPIWME